VGKHLIYRINKGLSIISAEVANHLGHIAEGKYVREEGNAFFRTMRMIDQEVQCWNAVAIKSQVTRD
jgi:hypothetical protein